MISLLQVVMVVVSWKHVLLCRHHLAKGCHNYFSFDSAGQSSIKGSALVGLVSTPKIKTNRLFPPEVLNCKEKYAQFNSAATVQLKHLGKVLTQQNLCE